MNRVDRFLQHYASEYYDPVKAHEYYMRTRELTGRKTSGMSEQQRETWKVTKDNISTKKKGEVTQQQELKKQRIEQFRATAEAKREAISEKLQLLSEKLSKDREEKSEDISEDVQSEIDRLPKGLSAEQRREKIAKIRQDGAKDRGSLSKETKEGRAKASGEAKSQREEVRTTLKFSVQMAREAYATMKTSLDKSYEKTYQTEYDKIMKEVPGKKTKRRKK